ncbi:hypothetical protein Leryth_015835 [Lithospermum erythrorhizon]|nr:hypothetical protein Leryth_015835 [Lithospermum erythrorhizon]
MLIRCRQASHLLNTLKHNCKTIKQVLQIHAQAITRGIFLIHPHILHNQILHSFTKTLQTYPPDPKISLHYVTNLFNIISNPNTFCYNNIIRAHTLLSKPQNALTYFKKMLQFSIPPGTHTYPFTLKACAQIKSLSLVKTLHCQTTKNGFLADVYVFNSLIHIYALSSEVENAYKVFDESCHRDLVSYNAMIDGFVKCGEVDKARELFDQMSTKDAVSWGTILSGYAKMNRPREAIELFEQMMLLNIRPDNIALVSVLSACAQLGELEKGMIIHDYVLSNGIELDEYLTTGLVDMYAKCGLVEKAREIFELCHKKNVFTWNALLVGLAMNGDGKLVLDYFSRMVESGTRPDGVTILGVLVGCSHAGLVNEARRIFNEMECIHGIPPELKHYGCMADLLGRAGLTKEAMEMIEAMPIKGDVFVWGGLLGGCRLHGEVEMAEKAAEHLMELKPEDGGAYSILANMYVNAERWDDLVKIRKLRDCRSIKKIAGCSMIQLNGITHEFVAGDDLHPETDEIYMVLNGLEQHH